jgi:hypothetical protein
VTDRTNSQLPAAQHSRFSQTVFLRRMKRGQIGNLIPGHLLRSSLHGLPLRRRHGVETLWLHRFLARFLCRNFSIGDFWPRNEIEPEITTTFPCNDFRVSSFRIIAAMSFRVSLCFPASTFGDFLTALGFLFSC